jgi:coproporphyrinogen III oxidase-like Fe-S oxidoreductase
VHHLEGARTSILTPPTLRDCVADRFAPQYDLTGLLTNVHRGHAEEDFDAIAIRDLWRRHVSEDKKRACRCELSAYLHIPFCKQKCAYCCYYSVPLERPGWLARYLDSLRAQLAFFAPAFSGRRFEALYIGGGTPSLMSPDQLEGLLKPLFESYSFCNQGERAFEFNPFSVDPGKLAVLERFGFNRISMGVQSFRPEVLKSENRGYQTYATVAKAVGLILSRGRFVLNVDLLVGLRGDDQDSFLKTLDALLALKPNTVTAYPVKPTVSYLAQHYGGDRQRFDADLARRYGDVGRKAAAIARRRGYHWRPERPELGDNDWLFRRDPLREFAHVYDDIAPHPVSVFALGPTARSRIAGALAYYQNGAHETAFRPEAAVWRGLRLDRRWEMRKFVLRELLDRAAVSRRDFRKLFGRDLESAFPSTSEALRLLSDPTPRRRFLAALHFLGQEELEAMSEVRLALSSAKGRWLLRLLSVAPGEPYLCREQNLALILDGKPAPLVSPNLDDRLLKLVGAAFLSAARRERRPSAARVAPVFLEQLRALLARLGRAGRLKAGFLRLERDRP